jgi:hypothetical protein
MPKVEIDYSNTIIYKITCKDPSITDVYVGHTTNFVQRKNAHKQSCKNDNCKLYTVIRDNGGWQNWNMEIVNFFNCHDHYEARKNEQEYFILLNATLNSIEPLPRPKQKQVVIKCSPKPTCDVSNTIFGNEKLNEEHIKISPKLENNFSCLCCDFKCCKKGDYNRHLLTAKHNNLVKINHFSTNGANFTSKNVDIFVCNDCNKQYKERSGLWRHKKNCKGPIVEPVQNDTITLDMNLIMDLLKQNDEFKGLMLEQNNKMMEAFQEVCKNNIAKEVTIDKTL